jgi:integrase
MVRLLLLTAQRRAEVGKMAWNELDLDNGTWSLPSGRTKNGKAHLVHLAPLAVEILRAIPREGALVFSGRDYSHSKRRLDAAIGISDWFCTICGVQPVLAWRGLEYHHTLQIRYSITSRVSFVARLRFTTVICTLTNAKPRSSNGPRMSRCWSAKTWFRYGRPVSL